MHYSKQITISKIQIIIDTLDSALTIPTDSVTISIIKCNIFSIPSSSVVRLRSPPQTLSWGVFVNSLYPWKKSLIKQSNFNDSHSYLYKKLQLKNPLQILTNEYSTNRKILGGQIIFLLSGNILVTDSNPIFGEQDCNHTYRSETHATLVALLLIHTTSISSPQISRQHSFPDHIRESRKNYYQDHYLSSSYEEYFQNSEGEIFCLIR